MRVYIAGRFEAQHRLRVMRDLVEALGHEVVGTWLDEESTSDPTEAEALEYAVRDFGEIRACDLFILDTLDENLRGGREAEYGYAWGVGKVTLIVGPRRNVFHTLAEKQVEEWPAALQWLMV